MKLVFSLFIATLLSPLAFAQDTAAACKAMKCVPSMYGKEYTGCTCPQNSGDPALRGKLQVPPQCSKTTDADGAEALQCDFPGIGNPDDPPPVSPAETPHEHVAEPSTDRQTI